MKRGKMMTERLMTSHPVRECAEQNTQYLETQLQGESHLLTRLCRKQILLPPYGAVDNLLWGDVVSLVHSTVLLTEIFITVTPTVSSQPLHWGTIESVSGQV